MTIRHYFDFKDKNRVIKNRLDSFVSWDTLRIHGKNDDPFSIPESRLLWEKKCLDNPLLDQQAADIKKIVHDEKYQRINSYGVGGAFLEYLIKMKAPDVFLQCSDYTPLAIQRLKRVFVDADEIIEFDILENEWPNDGPHCLYLFYRIDTIFNDEQWQFVFKKLSESAIENILFIPAEFLTVRRFISQKVKFWMYKLSGAHISFAGYLRTEDQIKAMFNPFYDIKRIIEIGDLKGILLALKAK